MDGAIPPSPLRTAGFGRCLGMDRARKTRSPRVVEVVLCAAEAWIGGEAFLLALPPLPCTTENLFYRY